MVNETEIDFLKKLYSKCKNFKVTDKDCYVKVYAVDTNTSGRDYIESFHNAGDYSIFNDKKTITKKYKNIQQAINFVDAQMNKESIEDCLIEIKVSLFNSVYSHKGLMTCYEDESEYELAYIWGYDLDFPIINKNVEKLIYKNTGYF
jgi:hypothetical protein|tara:strand:+ start:365 stop:805 length:441 start_codon:yes stop_codon:yes gene_type:complete